MLEQVKGKMAEIEESGLANTWREHFPSSSPIDMEAILQPDLPSPELIWLRKLQKPRSSPTQSL